MGHSWRALLSFDSSWLQRIVCSEAGTGAVKSLPSPVWCCHLVQVTQGSDTLGGKGPIDDHPSTNSSCPPKPEEKSKLEDPGGRLDRGHQDLSNSLLLSLVPSSHPRKGRQEGEGTCPGHMGTGCRVVTLFSETCSSASLCDPRGASFSPADTGGLFRGGSEAHNQISVLRRERAGEPVREESPL